MNLFTLTLRRLAYHRRRHLLLFLGLTVASAVLTGALVVGDSVRYSLERVSLVRLGRVNHALATGDRFFRSSLARELSADLSAPVSALLLLEGTAQSGDGKRRLPRVQVVGVDASFWGLGREEAPLHPGPDEAVVNAAAARALGVSRGDDLVLRLRKPGGLPAESSLGRSRELWSGRVTVTAVARDRAMGRFSLRISQVPPLSVFVPRRWLAQRLGLAGKANALVTVRGEGGTGVLNRALAERWRLEDSGLRLSRIDGGAGAELRSARVFLTPEEEKAALSLGGKGVVTYFVNELQSIDGSTPYSFVSTAAPEKGTVLKEDEIILTDWLAGDLGARVGDEVVLRFFALRDLRGLQEREARFTVRAVRALDDSPSGRALMPDFPGLANVDSCTEWDPSVPIDLDRIRDRDEAYWEKHRGTPKAFISLAAARRIWTTPWGALTAVRWSDPAGFEELRQALSVRIAPASLGVAFRNVRQEALDASAHSVDFAELFAGLSFFLIVSALLLAGLLYVLHLEDRKSETGLLLALGFTPARVRRLYLAEGALLSAAASVLGAAAAVAYTLAVLAALSTLWRGAVGTSALVVRVEPLTLVAGAAGSAAAGLIVLWLALRRTLRRGAHALQVGAPAISARKAGRLSLPAAGVFLALALVLVLLQSPNRGPDAAGAYFGAGSLLLLAGLATGRWLLARLAGAGRGAVPGVAALGLRSAARRPGRSLTLVAVLACGVFLVLSVSANRHDPASRDGTARSSGTGGFALIGECTLPLQHDPNTAAGRKALGLGEDETAGVSFALLRARPGDDASCLNLNRVARPRLLGLDSAAFARRGAFAFAARMEGVDRPWEALAREGEDGALPAIADQTVIVWGLGKSVGDTITYLDEQGRPFDVRLVAGLANSVFQGNILVDATLLRRRFPSVAGASVFLVDVDPARKDEVRGHLAEALADQGCVVQDAAARLAGFYEVENTYLDIFLLLGGLAMCLGTAGLGVVVQRNVLERRSELALLSAAGFSRPRLAGLLLAEHGMLAAAGLLVGSAAAAVAVAPALAAPGGRVPYALLAGVLAALGASAMAATWAAARFALRGSLVTALRHE